MEYNLKILDATEYQALRPVVRIGSPTPSLASKYCPPPLGPRKETHSLAGGGGISDEGTDTLVLYVYYNPSALDAFI
jgi:hypothetical protein